MKQTWLRTYVNIKMVPEEDKKLEKRCLEWTKAWKKWDLKSVRPPNTLSQ